MRALQLISRHPKSEVFRFRRDVPPNLRPILGQKVFTETLGTKREDDAFRLGLPVVARYQKLFDEAEAVHRQRVAGEPVAVALTLEEAAGLVERWREAELARVASEVAARPRGLAPTREAVERYLETCMGCSRSSVFRSHLWLLECRCVERVSQLQRTV